MTSDVSIEMPSKKNLPYGMVLFLGMLLTCLVANAVTIPMQSGIFTSWKSLSNLPSKAIRIVEADQDNVWVEADDGQIYTATLWCKGNESCYQWTIIVDKAEIEPLHFQPIKRGENCSSLGGSSS